MFDAVIITQQESIGYFITDYFPLV